MKNCNVSIRIIIKIKKISTYRFGFILFKEVCKSVYWIIYLSCLARRVFWRLSFMTADEEDGQFFLTMLANVVKRVFANYVCKRPLLWRWSVGRYPVKVWLLFLHCSASGLCAYLNLVTSPAHGASRCELELSRF